MNTLAVVFQAPERLELQKLALQARSADQVLVEVEYSGISTGTERLLWTGQMPPFPGLGYPLVPGYESVGRVLEGDDAGQFKAGERVFVPGASCFGGVKGLFGGAASRLVVPAARLCHLDESLGDEEGVLLALAATAEHAIAQSDGRPVELIVGHGVLGRLLARLAVARGHAPVVWEKNPARASGAMGYTVTDGEHDGRRDYQSIYDVSGDPALIEPLLGRLKKGGELVLAGFYPGKVQFSFPVAFMREARLRVAAEWAPQDLEAVLALVKARRLSLQGLITHHAPHQQAAQAYRTAFTDPACLKMLLDWRSA